MAGQALAVRNGDSPAVVKPSLDELAATVRREHERCMAGLRTTVDHAIRSGEALLAAREITMPGGMWVLWLEEYFPGHRSQAYLYMRLATYKDLLPAETTLVAANKLVAGLPSFDGSASRKRLPDPKRDDAKRLRDEGLGYKRIAKHLGVSVSTVHSWFNGTKRSHDRRAREALRRQKEQKAIKRAVKKAGAALSEAYSMAERLDDVLGQAHREATDPETRRELAKAHEFQRALRDAIVRGLGVE